MKTAGNLGFDVANYSNANGGNVQLWGQTPNAAQIFYISKNKDGWYTIKNFASGKVLDVSAGKNANGTNIQQWDANGRQHRNLSFTKMHKEESESYLQSEAEKFLISVPEN